MNIVTKHVRSVLVGGTLALVLATAGTAWADQPANPQQQAASSTQMPADILSKLQDAGAGEREEGTTTDGRRWYRFRYYYHHCYYYSPVYYYYCYTPTVVWHWRPVVVSYDGTGAARDGRAGGTPDKVTDGAVKFGGN